MRRWPALAARLTLALIVACVLVDELQTQIDGGYRYALSISVETCQRISVHSGGCNISGLQSMAPTPNFSAGCNVNPASILNETLQIYS